MDAGSLHLAGNLKVRPRRSNTTLPKLTSSTQTIDPPEAKKTHRHHHSHHHLPRRHAKDSQSSRIHINTLIDSSRHLNRNGEYTPSSTANESRRGSSVGLDAAREENDSLQSLVKPEDLVKERQRVNIRNLELRSSLQALSEHSMKTTRDLDDGFYSCLEKLSVLQSTISTLQELSSLTRQLHNSFQGETGDLTTEMQERINNLGGFKAQHDRVDGLESRVMSSKDKAKRLSAKLEGARARVQTLEAQEAEWQATVTRRINLVWLTFGTVSAALIALLVFHSFKTPTNHTGQAIRVNHSALLSTPRPSSLIGALQDVPQNLSTSTETNTANNALKPSPKVGIEEDPRLRLFEEL